MCISLYADDTILLSETPEDLQHQLSVFKNYCNYWHLKVNIDKTKVVIFCKGHTRKEVILFTLNGEPLKIVDIISSILVIIL